VAPERIDYEAMVRMLRGAATTVKANRETLSKLDSVGGDGDHGTTMARAMAEIEDTAAQPAGDTIQSLLHDAGWALMGVDGGAAGPLFGTLLMSMAEAASGKESLDADALASLFEAGLAGVRKWTRAEVGDKTMLDALVPAVRALREAASAGADVPDALRAAAEAAETGAVETKDLQARFGRAKHIGEASIGTQDPGATSVSLMFRGFSEGVTANARS